MHDLQVNGFTGKDFSCSFWEYPDDESIIKLSRFLYEEGILSFLATIITDSTDNLMANLKRIEEFRSHHYSDLKSAHEKRLAYISGVHMEGGLISKAGVHPEKFCQELHFNNARTLVSRFSNLIKLWTLCPKEDQNGDVTRLAQDNNILVSYGHSDADYETSMNCFDKYQVRHVTHWGNAMYVMKSFSQRNCSEQMLDRLDESKLQNSELGLGYAAYHHPDVSCMAICGSEEDFDLHLDPKVFAKLANKKKDKLILVSDMVAYNGPLPPEKLVGGLASLKKHYSNAMKLTEIKISNSVEYI
jgi:N-acetylglucosamine-6-phosphate deacetylase